MDKLEGCLEEVGCANITLARVVIILLLYFDDIVIMVRYPYDLDKQLRFFKDFALVWVWLLTFTKTKVMIIKSKMITNTNFVYDNTSLEEMTSYKYIWLDLHHKLSHSIENGWWEAYIGLENNCKLMDVRQWYKKKLMFVTLVTMLSYMVEKFVVVTSLENGEKDQTNP